MCRAGLRGGVAFATGGGGSCSVAFSGSALSNNTAVAGAVGFLVNNSDARGPCAASWLDGNTASNNTATSWGPRFATNISNAVALLASPTIASGANVQADRKSVV